MSVVDVEKLIKAKEANEKMTEFKEQADDAKIKRQIKPKKVKIELGRKPQPVNPVVQKIQIQNMLEEMRESKQEDAEMSGGLKKGLFFVASLPITAEKRPKLRKNLEDSKFLNRYIDKNLYVNYLDSMNQDIKALACYGYHYLDALKGE